MNITFETADTFTATSRGVSATVNVAALSPTIIANLFAYGLTQKLADAASGAVKDAAEGAKINVDDKAKMKEWSMSEAGRMAIAESTATMMTKAADALAKGEWSTRGEGSGVSVETRVGRSLMRSMMKAKADSKAWAAFTGLTDAAQNEKIDANIAKNADVMREKVTAEIKRLDALRVAKAKIGDGLTIDL